jgi:hypothetical protein
MSGEDLQQDLIFIFILAIVFNFIDLFFGIILLGFISTIFSLKNLMIGTSYSTNKYQNLTIFWFIFSLVSSILYVFLGKIWLGNFLGTAKIGYNFLIFLKESFKFKK